VASLFGLDVRSNVNQVVQRRLISTNTAVRVKIELRL
jgi:hypothetical protein